MSLFIQNMATTIRHNQLVKSFSAQVWNLEIAKKLVSFQEEISLCYCGKRYSEDCALINIEHTPLVFHLYSTVQPDFFLFQKNEFKVNSKQTKIAGYPDLIVEVWSECNDIYEREFKRYIYGTSFTTEHWYIDQDSNVVECFVGRNKLPNKDLKNDLYSESGLYFNLQTLSL